MKCKNELEYLSIIVQDYISKQDRSVQIALAEKAQACVSAIQTELQSVAPPTKTK